MGDFGPKWRKLVQNWSELSMLLLKRETTLTVKRIAQRVRLGTAESASVRLPVWMKRAETVFRHGHPRT